MVSGTGIHALGGGQCGGAGRTLPPPGGQDILIPPDCPYTDCQMGFLEKIKQAKDEWESTVDVLAEIILLLDPEGGVMRANRAVEGWGLGRVRDVNGMGLHEFMHRGCDDPDCYLAAFIDSAWDELALGRRVACDADDPRLNRHVRVELRVGDRDGESPSSHMVAIVHDITEIKQAERTLKRFNEELEARVQARTAELRAMNENLKREIGQRAQAEKALQDSQKRYRLLVETMNEGLAMQDTAGKLAYVNERLGQMLGYAREEMLGTAPVEYVDDESLRGWQKRMLERQVGEPQPYELYLKAKDGRKIFAKISPRLIFDSEGRYGGSFAVVTDLTERMRAEQGLRESESELRLLSAQLLTAQEQERKRIASELHDGIGQSLSAVKFSVEDALRLLAEKSAQKSARSLESVIPKIQAAIEEVRRMSMDLRPSTLDDLGIIPTLAWFFRQFEAIYDDIRVVKKIDIQENDVPVPLKTTIFRIMQEAMNNVAKHGKAGMASVTLRRLGDTLEMLIQDDGQGFSVEEVSVRESQHRGFGLASMRERAEFSGGSYSISSAKGDGTRIRVAWPCCGVRQVSAA